MPFAVRDVCCLAIIRLLHYRTPYGTETCINAICQNYDTIMEEPGGMESGLTVKNLQHHFRAFILHRARLASES